MTLADVMACHGRGEKAKNKRKSHDIGRCHGMSRRWIFPRRSAMTSTPCVYRHRGCHGTEGGGVLMPPPPPKLALARHGR